MSDLLDRKIIVKSGEKKSDFRLFQNENIWIGSKNDHVIYIYSTPNSGDEFLGFDPFKFEYPATKPITEFLNTKYKQVLFKDIDETQKKYTGDRLYMIFRDFIPSNIFLMRLEN